MRLQFVITLRTVLALVIGAQVGFLVALEHDVAVTLIWPPSGIALAIYFLRGDRVLPGIVIAGVVTSLILYHSLPFLNLLAVMLVGSASAALSTYVAGQLLRQVAPAAPIWGSAREIMLGFLCMGVAAGIPAILNTYVFYFNGLVTLDGLSTRMGIYWLGELCGMLVFTTPSYLAGRKVLRDSLGLDKLSSVVSPTALYSAICAVALLMFIYLQGVESADIEADLEREANIAAGDLQEALRTAARDLESIRALAYAHQSVLGDEFLRYTSTEFDQRGGHLNAKAIGYAPLVTDPTAWNLEMLSKGRSEHSLFQSDEEGERTPASGRDDYFPLELIYPYDDTNRRALGFDLGSEPMRRSAIERARDTGQVSLVVPIYLVQSSGRVTGMLMCWPIYSADKPLTSVDKRRAAFTGVASGVYHVGTFFDNAMTTVDPDVSLHLLDISSPEHPLRYHTRYATSVIFPEHPHSDFTLPELTTRMHGKSRFEYAGRTWVVVANPVAAYVLSRRTWTPWIMLALVLTLAIATSSILIERIVTSKRLEEEQQNTLKALEEARAANESKSFFMAAASHDIKQPLYALSMLTDTLLMANPPENTLPVIKHLQTSVKEMSQHFDTLMDVGRFQTGSFEIRPIPFALPELSRRIALEIGPLCREKGLDWFIDFDRVEIESDPDLLLRLIRNLLINAVRYTGKGTIRCTAKQSDHQSVRFTISDTGPGLTEEQVGLVRAKISEVEEGERQAAGFGMGLSIVQKISDSLGLDIKVTTETGRGTEFTFEIPLRAEITA